MRRERARVLREGRMESLESGGVREEGWKAVLGARVAVGRRKEVSAEGMDLVRWNVGARWVAMKEGDAKSFWGCVSRLIQGRLKWGGELPRCWRSILGERQR